MATYKAKKEGKDVDGVATRSKEEEEALVKAANEFQKSKLKASETDKEKETVVVEKEKVEPVKPVAPQPEKDKK